MATDLTQLQVIEPGTDISNITIGNSKYSDDIWDLRLLIPVKTIKENQKYIRFGYISNADMKEVVKQYAYYKLGKTKPHTVRVYINGHLPSFVEYCSLTGINSFANVTLEDYLGFNHWMKDEKRVAVRTGNKICHIVEEIIRIGQIKGWNVPQFHLPKTASAGQLWNEQKTRRNFRTKPIPEDVFDKVLYHAVHDEKDVLTKAGIIIQSQTGIRINEVLSIREGCVKRTLDGYDYMEVTLSKTEKGEPVITVYKPGVLAELNENTMPLRWLLDYKFRFKTRDTYWKCQVKYQKGKEKTLIEGEFADPNKEKGRILFVRDQVEDTAEANKLAKKKLREANKEQVTGTFTTIGNHNFAAGQIIEMKNFGKFDGRYLAVKVTHTVNEQYVTSIDIRRCLDGY